MSIDLGELFATAEGLIAELIPTCGTWIRIDRDPDGALGGTTDPDTLDVTPTKPVTTIYPRVPALVVPANGADTVRPLPGVVLKDSDYRIIGLSDLVDVLDGDHVTVLESLDGRLPKRTFTVTGIPDSSSGAIRVLEARSDPRKVGDRA